MEPQPGDRGQGAPVHVVAIAGRPPDPHVELVVEVIASSSPVRRHEVMLDVVGERLEGKAAHTFGLFAHTPQPLIDSWLLARAISSLIPDGGSILVSDHEGLGGVTALTESQRSPTSRRRIWTVAGSGRFLTDTIVYGTTDHLDMPAASEVDWELVQYRTSDRVFSTSRAALDVLADLGVAAEIPITLSAPRPTGRSLATTVRTIHAPGPVERRNRFGDVLRAVASVPGVTISVSDVDTPDDVWTGTTWDANSAIRDILGDRLRRVSAPPSTIDVVVVGDVLAAPSPVVTGLHDAGIPIVAPEGSVLSMLWPDVVEWSSSDDLAAILTGSDSHLSSASTTEAQRTVVGDATAAGERARHVSVGIPVFGSSAYLDACIESVLAQTQPVTEIIVVDDGSRSEDVDRTLRRWGEADDRIRIVHQPNRGVCVARNTMLEAMTGDAFVLVDQDDVLDADFVAATAAALRADRLLTAVATWTEFFGEYSAIEAKPPFDRRIGRRENPIVSTGALVDMSVRDQGIRFAPDLAFLYCEDWHFWSQIVASGGRLGLVPAPLVRHRVHTASGGFRRTDLALRIGRARAIAPMD